MNKLEPLHEQAIDLFVAGKKQCEIANELNINPRTLRRWSDSELFIQELNRQHAQARKLEQDAAAEYNRQRSAFHLLFLKRIEMLLNDPTTPPHLIAVCLKLGMQDIQATARQNDAQRWREHVYAEKKAEREAKAAASREEREKFMTASKAMGPSGALIEHLFNHAAKADKSGHPPSGPDVPPAPDAAVEEDTSEPEKTPEPQKADKSGHPTPPPIVKPVQPFRYPRPEKKAAQAPQPVSVQEK